MSLKKSLKLTAIGVSLASIAITGCNGKNNDSGSKDSKGKDTKPNIIKNLSVSMGNIPLGGCAPYSVTATDSSGNEINFTNSGVGGFGVYLSNDQSKKRFEVNENRAVVCTKENGPDGDVKPAINDTVELTVVSNTGVIAHQKAKVVAGSIIKTATIKNNDDSTNSHNNPIIVSVGLKTKPFNISYNTYDDPNLKKATSANDFELQDDKGNKLELKTVEVQEVVDGESKLVTKFVFDIPKNAVVASDSLYYNLKSKSNSNFNQIIYVKISEPQIVSAALKYVGTGNANINQNILAVDTVYLFRIIATLSDGKTVDLTAENSDKIVNVSTDANLGANFTAVLTNVEDAVDVARIPANNELNLPEVPRGNYYSAFGNYVRVSADRLPADFNQKAVLIRVRDRNVAAPARPLADSASPFYIGTHKPVLSKVNFNYQRRNPNGIGNTLTDVNNNNPTSPIRINNNVISIPVGGTTAQNLLCANLNTYNITLNRAERNNINFEGGADALRDFKIELPVGSKLKIIGRKICALASAEVSDKEFDVKIQNKYDDTLSSIVKFKVGQAESTDKAVFDITTDTAKTIALTGNNRQNISLKFLKSDNTLGANVPVDLYIPNYLGEVINGGGAIDIVNQDNNKMIGYTLNNTVNKSEGAVNFALAANVNNIVISTKSLPVKLN